MTFQKLLFLLAIVLYTFLGNAQTTQSDNNTSPYKIRATAELGYLAVLDHKIQFGNNGTYIDYVDEGGQNVLFPVSRFSLELDVNNRNTFVFLYQPLRISTQALLDKDVIIDDLTFPSGTSVKFLYNFPFYRLSYLRELLSQNEKYKLAVGGTIQIRNATISFESADGTLYRDNGDIGIVPALKVRGKAQLNRFLFAEIEADGIYAPVSYLNGSDNEIVGAILDASLRLGTDIKDHSSVFLNLRYLGGGAVGTDEDDEGPGDGYVKNWLHFLTVTTGFTYSF